VQYWAKPLPKGAAALYVLNTNTTHAKPITIALTKVREGATLGQKLSELLPFTAASSQGCAGQLASFGSA
jgi:hypothetical protein